MKKEAGGWITPASLEQWDLLRMEMVQRLHAVNAEPLEVISFLVAAEEMFVNIVQHAYKKMVSKNATVFTELKIEILGPHTIKATIDFSDKGISFNPLAHPSKAKESRLGAIAPGGWGISIAREKTDEMRYSRDDGRNRLTLIKTISTDGRKIK